MSNASIKAKRFAINSFDKFSKEELTMLKEWIDSLAKIESPKPWKVK